LICRYFRATEPPQHKADREAGRCEGLCGDDWDQYTWVQYVKNHGRLEGWCFRFPKAEQVGHSHVCGEVTVPEYFLNHSWQVEPLQPRDNLFAWASKALDVVLRGNPTDQSYRHLEEQNTELRRQLKRSREISASRLKRLRKPKPEAEPEQPAEPFRPRLVAAE